MCGITGIYSFSGNAGNYTGKLQKSVESLKHRGPDASGLWNDEFVALGHSRLSVIDTSASANQPMHSQCGRYHIVFNGEIYNYKDLRNHLQKKYKFISQSDTEVIMYAYAEYGENFLSKLNGCFALAIYDSNEQSLLLARDRFGIKPLLIYSDAGKIIFASEMKAVLAYQIPKKINYEALDLYFRFNYIPQPHSILQSVTKLTPGTYLKITQEKTVKKQYYTIAYKQGEYSNISYEDAQKTLKEKLYNAVEERLVADVPLGSFLSGGIDSSVIAGIASEFSENINTFSIGYKDNSFFDETEYALEVAKKFNTNHNVFKLSNADLFEHFTEIINSIDEPFADSSAIPVYILSKLTRKQLTVALSGDGADEIFAGYNKHMAHYKAVNPSIQNSIIKIAGKFTKYLPQSRNSYFSNKIRQINKYASALSLSDKERYLRWASLFSAEENDKMFSFKTNQKRIERILHEITENITSNDINDILYSDMLLVLPSDMLFKVDKMSMANSLEVRTPFLDHNIVDFAFGLDASYKINAGMKKRLLQDAFRNFLPEKIYNRPKHGFEVPLTEWFKTELWTDIDKNYLSEKFITEQNIFNYEYIKKLKQKLLSSNPGDSPARIWALIVFQNWYRCFLDF